MKNNVALQQLVQRGLRHHQAGQLPEAKALYQQALGIDPQHPDALNLMGTVLLQLGQPGEAMDRLQRAARRLRDNPGVLGNLAQAYFALGQYEQAREAFRKASRLNPRAVQFQLGMANSLAMQGKFSDAEILLRKQASRFPNEALVWHNLGNVLRDLARPAEALDCYRTALALDPRLVDTRNNLGGALQALLRFEEAEREYRACTALAPDYVVAKCNLASVLIDLGRFKEAEEVLREVIRVAPEMSEAHAFLAAALGHQGRLLEALEFHRKAAALAPDNARAVMALGSALYELGDTTEGLPLLERAVSLAPESWETHFSVAVAKLAVGEFDEGWREFFHRPTRVGFVKRYPDVALASSLASDMTGRHVCLHREQGLGDQLFFLRFARYLKQRGARITYRSTPKIAGMLARVTDLDSVIPDTEPIPEADHVLLVSDLPMVLGCGETCAFKPRSIMRRPRLGPPGAFIKSLPRALKINYPEIPPPLALTPLPDQLRSIREQLAALGPPPYIGLTWLGGVAPEDQRNMAWTLFKRIPLRQLGETLRDLPATYLALQRNPQAGEIAQLSEHLGQAVHDLTTLNEDLEAMLALLALIDDYVGVSNTNMHLRAGVGKTARVLVPCPAEWRWMAAGSSSPWFPGFPIYRQSLRGDWRAALASLKQDLAKTYL